MHKTPRLHRHYSWNVNISSIDITLHEPLTGFEAKTDDVNATLLSGTKIQGSSLEDRVPPSGLTYYSGKRVGLSTNLGSSGKITLFRGDAPVGSAMHAIRPSCA